jgi:hypothetical protein
VCWVDTDSPEPDAALRRWFGAEVALTGS